MGALLRAAGSFIKRKPLGATGAFFIFLGTGMAIAAPLLAPYDPVAIDHAARLRPPSHEFLLGTDNFGRDVLSRTIYGSRISLYVGFMVVLLGDTLGGLLGVISGYLGGRIDFLFQRLVDTFMAFPVLILALAIVAVLGPSIGNVILAIAIVEIPREGRVLRSVALSLRQNMYIEAAQAVGCSEGRIILRHVLPQCVAPYLVMASASLGWAIVVEASLSFLGVGTPPPLPSWGNMLANFGRDFAEQAPWMALAPGIAITIFVLAINLFGDALRDTLDPRLRQR